MAKKQKSKKRTRKMSKMEKFAKEQLERYVEIHKENEKDLSYIG